MNPSHAKIAGSFNRCLLVSERKKSVQNTSMSITMAAPSPIQGHT